VIACEIETAELENGWYFRSALLSDRLRGGRYDLEYMVTGSGRIGETCIGDALVAALLLPSMALGEDLRIEADVSPRLLGRMPDIAAIYQAWTLGVSHSKVSAPTRLPTRGGNGDALFFSGGTDSFYSLLKHRPGGLVSQLVFVSGFDIPLGNPALEAALTAVHRVAESTGAAAVTVTTNLRSLSEPIVGWGAFHGAVLASAGLLLSGNVSRCLVPASRAYQYLTPWGSHPVLDPMWSTEVLEFIHDGAEAVRHQKLGVVAQDPLGQGGLRVCLQPINGQDKYNCGRCEKCLVTMLALQLQGLLADVTTFPALDLRLVESLSTQAIGTLRELATRPDADRPTAAALERVRRERIRAIRIQGARSRIRSVVSPRRTTAPMARVARIGWKARMMPLIDDISDSYASENAFRRVPESFLPEG
jgi:hypothetical protein